MEQKSLSEKIRHRVEQDKEHIGTGLVAIIVLGVAMLGDVMYIQLMHSIFPTGLLFVFCIVGAFASFLSMCYLLIGKHVFFHPGRQMYFAWGLVVIDLVVTGLNIIDVFYRGQLGGFLNLWPYIAPTTPLIIMAGVLVVHFSSPSHEARHKEMQYDDELADIEREFRLAQKRVDHQLKLQALNIIETMATHDMHSPEEMARLAGISRGWIASAMSNLSGYTLPPTARVDMSLPSAKTVESSLRPARFDQATPTFTIKGKQFTVDELVKLADTLLVENIDTEALPAQDTANTAKQKKTTKA
jgi:hypothetical protein